MQVALSSLLPKAWSNKLSCGYFMMQASQRADEIEKLVENVGDQVCWILLFHATLFY